MNIEKTKVVQLGAAGDGRMINIEKEKLELTDEFVLLGIQFNSKRLSKITEDNCRLKFPKMKKVLRQWKRRKLTISGRISVFKSLVSSMLTHILLSLPNPSLELSEEYEKMLTGFLWGGKPAKFRREILEYPYDLGGLQLHNLQRFSSSLKITWLRRIIATDCSWTTFAISYEIDKCWNFGNDFAKQKKNTMINIFWKDVVQSIINLREYSKPKTDLDYLCWPLWYDQYIKLPLLQKLKKKNVCIVADLLGINWEIMTKVEIERSRGVNLNFLEYLSIKQSVKRFIKKCR